MTSQLSSKGLPPPPLRIDKRRNMSSSNQLGASHQWPATAAATGGPSHLGAAPEENSAAAKLSRTPSGRFRIRVPSLTKQSRSSESAQGVALTHNHVSQIAHSQPQNNKAWQPRWAPKLKRTNPSESVTAYSPILDAPLPPLPSFIASPPPAVQLDDTGFGRPFSTAGLLDFNASRFSFLDMSNQDHDSDSDSQDSHAAPAHVQPLPTICEPSISQQGHTMPPLSPTGPIEPATASSSLQPESSREMLKVLHSSSPPSAQDMPSTHMSLPTSSPALASLISSFPSPLIRDRSLPAPPSSSHLLAAEAMESDVAEAAPGAAAMKKENSWDGGERWPVEEGKHSGVPSEHASTELPYLDMDDDDSKTELIEAALAKPSSASIQPQLSSSSISPTRNRPIRNPPPLPAPNMALPDLPPRASAAVSTSVRRHTPTSSVQLDMQQHTTASASASSSKSAQRPLILPSLRSSTSIDRLAAMGSSSSSPLDKAALARTTNASHLKPLTLSRSAFTNELAQSLDIPRETVKQMLDTTQHVWRNHLLGSVAMHVDQPITSSGLKRVSRSSSSPMLSTMFAAQGSSDTIAVREDTPKGGVAKQPAGKSSNRSSMLGLPYISSSRPSFEHQSPGWAVTKHSMETSRPTTLELQAERARHRRTFLGRSSEDGPAASYNFSRPMRRNANAGMVVSASMPALATASEAPRPPALLQSPLLLKGESEATGFAQFIADDEQEILVDSSSEAHQPFVLARAPLPKHAAGVDKTAESALSPRQVNVHKPVPALPLPSSSSSPRLVRRNSDTVLNRFAPEFGKRAPGELHAWSVCIDNDGVPAIRPTQSAFHRPSCPLADKNNATWQCGCRSSISHDAAVDTPSLAVPGQSSPGRNRSLSASNVMDPIRQAQLWSQVEKNKELIRKHQREIAGLQEQVVRISTEMASARPSFSSALATPDLASVTAFPAPPARANASAATPSASVASPTSQRPPVPAKTTSVDPFPAKSAAPLPELPKSAAAQQVQPPRTLRGRIASLSKMNLAGESEGVRVSASSEPGHSRLRSSSSTSSLNKVFRFPCSRSSDKEAAFPEPMPFPLGERSHAKTYSSASSRGKALPRVRMYSVDESRPLPAPPLQDASTSGKDKRYPPSARKFSYDMLRGPAMHSSVGSRHLRGRSGSSKSSSFGTSIFSSTEGHEMYETSRFASFPRFGRRWDSISSRGTNTSARNSAEVSMQPGGASWGSMPALSSVATGVGKPMPGLPIEAETVSLLRPAKEPPPRRSSLMRKSVEAAPRRTPIPNEFLQANEGGMAPISELSEMGSPASVRVAPTRADLEMSPASIVGASPAGPLRMSMSERHRLQGLTVPAPLALSSSLASPALGSAAEPGSGTKVGEGAAQSPTSPRFGRSPLPVGFSHGALTVARRPSLTSGN